jgi:hypothetical protein
MAALGDCVFGIRGDSEGKDQRVEFYNWGEKQNIPAGFFRQPDAENVSAVLASNQATLTKFNRMGKIAGFGIQTSLLDAKAPYSILKRIT